MTTISAVDRPLTWASVHGGAISNTGVTLIGNTTVSTLLISADNEPEFLAAVVAAAPDCSTCNPLPGDGEWCEGGAIYSYDGALVICRQSHRRMIYAPADTPALFAVYRADAGEALEWIASEPVEVGMRRLYDGTLYECLQAHQTQVDWTPPATPALWAEVVVDPGEDWIAGVWVNVGDRRWYDGVLYECLQAHTTQAEWTPPVVPALWQVVS